MEQFLNPTGVLKVVVSSAAEAEIGALFVNAKEAEPIRTALEELGYPQNATPIQTDNSTAYGIVNETIKQRRSRAIDMRFYWLQDRVKQGHFRVYWAPGDDNLADYFTKHHSPAHHERMRPKYIYTPTNYGSSVLRGCVETPVNYVNFGSTTPVDSFDPGFTSHPGHTDPMTIFANKVTATQSHRHSQPQITLII